MANIISARERTKKRVEFWIRLHTNLEVFLRWNCPHIEDWGTDAEIVNGQAILVLHALCHAWLDELGWPRPDCNIDRQAWEAIEPPMVVWPHDEADQ